MYCWIWENFEHCFTSMWDECNCAVLWTFFGISFLLDWNENWLFSSPVPTAEFSKFAGILNAALSQHHLLGFEIAGIPTPPLALLVLMLPKAHLTSHSRMSGSRWVITLWLLSGSWKSFLYSSVFCCQFFLVSSASFRSMPFLGFTMPIFTWNVPLVSLIFMKRTQIFPTYCFPLFFCIDQWGRLSYLSLLFFGTLHSNGYIFPFLLGFSLGFSQLFVRLPQTTTLPFCISFSVEGLQHCLLHGVTNLHP